MNVAIYLTAIVLANLSVAYFGPSSTIINAFLFIGLDLTLRDRLHEEWRHEHLIRNMTLLIASGSILSYALNANAGPIALASFVAFALSTTTDAVVYALLEGKPNIVRVNGSNTVSALVDSLAFPTIAFGALMPAIVLGQFVAKVMGGLVWSMVIRRVSA